MYAFNKRCIFLLFLMLLTFGTTSSDAAVQLPKAGPVPHGPPHGVSSPPEPANKEIDESSRLRRDVDDSVETVNIRVDTRIAYPPRQEDAENIADDIFITLERLGSPEEEPVSDVNDVITTASKTKAGQIAVDITFSTKSCANWLQTVKQAKKSDNPKAKQFSTIKINCLKNGESVASETVN